jgi:hypothetical protein
VTNDCLLLIAQLLDSLLRNQTIGRNRENIKSCTNICKEVKLSLHNKNLSSFVKARKWS